MKTIIKLAVVLAVLNAAARGANAAWNYYQFKDAAQQLLVFGAQETPTSLHGQIMQKAVELDLPLTEDDVHVERRGARTFADARYTQSVEFFPSYRYPITFSFNVDAVSLSGLK